MPQINLLKQKTVTHNFWETLPKYLVWIFSVLLIAVLAYYGWLILQGQKASKAISAAELVIAQDKATVSQLPGTDKLLTRQAQLKILDGEINKHTYWSQLLPALAQVTLKTASYSNIKIAPDNTVILKVTVPDFLALDKFLQVFDIPNVNTNFSDVTIGGYHEVQDQNGNRVQFDIKMKFNGSVLNYRPVVASN